MVGPKLATYSQWNTFDTCPHWYSRKYRAAWEDKLPQDNSPALVKGRLVHDGVEGYLLEKVDTLPEYIHPSWKGYIDQFKGIGEGHIEVRLENDIAYGKLDVGLNEVIVDWKGLPLDTDIPTPDGWSTMQALQIGDKVFDKDGLICTVIGKSKIKHLPCFKITFDDRSHAACDEEHLWLLQGGVVVPIKDLQINDEIPTAAPLQTAPRSLPIDPYVLGIWLADGKHSSGEITNPDAGIWEEIQNRGFVISHYYSKGEGCRTHTVYGLRTLLREAGILRNKHIPTAYLRASYDQRLALLQGIYDGDGYANPARNQAVLETVDKQAAEQIQELALSLGQRATLIPYTARGFGLVKPAYMVPFRPRNLNPFLLPRKADQVAAFPKGGWAHRRKVRRIENLAPIDTQCIAVDSPSNTFLCTRYMIPTHNTGKARVSDIKMREQLRFYTWLRGDTSKAALAWVEHPFKRALLELTLPWTITLDRVWRKRILKMRTGPYPMTPGWKCGWCPVKTCEHNEVEE